MFPRGRLRGGPREGRVLGGCASRHGRGQVGAGVGWSVGRGSARTHGGPRRRAQSACSLARVPPTGQLQQMRELEQEKEVLLQGLELMARGRDWYQQQLQRVQERQRRLGQSRASAVSDAARGWAVPVPRHRQHPQGGTGRPYSRAHALPQGAGTPHTHTLGQNPPPATPRAPCLL